MSAATFHVGDAFAVMAGIPDGSVDLIVTSPPFLALRSYLPADHPDKGKEIGSEATPAAFLTTLLALTREWRRVLAPHGSIAVELGDTYSGNFPATGTNWGNDPKALGKTLPPTVDRSVKGWPLDKSLCLLPTLYPACLAYGRNLLDPTDVIDPLRVRNLIVWHRPNPAVGALGDKVRPSTSYVTVACMRRDRWFDLDAERTPFSEKTNQSPVTETTGSAARAAQGGRPRIGPQINTHAGAPPLDYWRLDEDDPAEHLSWTIPTQPYAGSHYATFPIALPRRLIRLMCPQHVCRQCGEPRRREVERMNPLGLDNHKVKSRANAGPGRGTLSAPVHDPQRETLGWSDCGHDDYRRGIVLDPFAGSGTTLAAATEQGRDAIGIDLDADNYWLARERVGMFLADAG